jgi:histidinol dehydrogenase
MPSYTANPFDEFRLRQLDVLESEFDDSLACLLKRDVEHNDDIDKTAREIIRSVRVDGDKAVIKFTRQFDGLDVDHISNLELSQEDIERLSSDVDKDVADALLAAAQRIRAFHEKEIPSSWSFTESDGTLLGQNVLPVQRAGIYVPGGKASYPSSVLMTAIPAKVAGVSEIIMTVPTPKGEINPAIIAAARICEVDRIFTIGGAQAIAALAYGTETIPGVDLIVGPGNAYVAAAKKHVFGDVGIDMIAGPSEVLVICDETADPDWVAMDLFAQAEHDELSQSIVVTNSESQVKRIQQSIGNLLPKMERRDIILKSLTDNGAIIKTENLQQAVDVSNRVAPEHLEIIAEDAEELLARVTNAGAIFVGKYSAEALGDYCAGPNHVLPTSGTARFSSPLGVYDFQKRSSIIRVSKEGAAKMAGIAATLAASEGLTAHEQSARFRSS